MATKKYWEGSERYLCDPELAQAFHISRTLGMPLLIEGEPGTGKTELPLQYAADQQLDLFVYPAGSKSNVEQFVAKFDHVKYLRDSQIEILNAQREEKGLNAQLSTAGRRTESLADYVLKGPATQAFSAPHSVLLIDEIDKAPREFPNDLLYALSHRKLVMPESGEVVEVSENNMPAIVITSNREQELPQLLKGVASIIIFSLGPIKCPILFKTSSKSPTKLLTRPWIYFTNKKNWFGTLTHNTGLLNWLKYIKTFSTKEAVTKLNASLGTRSKPKLICKYNANSV